MAAVTRRRVIVEVSILVVSVGDNGIFLEAGTLDDDIPLQVQGKI